MMGIHGPILLTPRLDSKPWGGRRLATFGFSAESDEPIGEAVITAPNAISRDGSQRTLNELIAADPLRAIGARGLAATGGRIRFPLLVKLIDAADDLSIQVHPNDAFAGSRSDGRDLGKTEAWWILDAQPGSVVYVGLRAGVTQRKLEDACWAGAGIAHLLRRIPVQPDTLFLLPAGTVHALGAGVMLYEIQQPSEITYRLDDWARRDARGRSRDLHIAEALAVTDLQSRPSPRLSLVRSSTVGVRHLLIACRYFALERITLGADETISMIAPESPQVITVTAGMVHVIADGTEVSLPVGQTTVLLADARSCYLQSANAATALRAWVPSDEEITLSESIAMEDAATTSR